MSLPIPTAANAATSPSTRFTPLSTHFLNAQPPNSETTLSTLIAQSEQLAEEAREALPYSFDECSYKRGYIRQSVWSCLDCGRGVCYGCSISCHGEHRLVELWTRRHFRCDCPTTGRSTQAETSAHRCRLNDPSSQPQECNQENKYGPNYSGKFCRCGRDYDPETETEGMLNCIACEDWFHESCLNLRPSLPGSNADITSQTETPARAQIEDHAPSEAKPDPEKINEDDEDDEEVLIKSDTYDGLICAACVSSHGYLRSQAGRTGWMVIEPKDGGWEVLGRADEQAPLLRSSDAADVGDTNGTDRSAGTDSPSVSVKAGANAKRSIEEVSPSEAESPALPVDKKAKKEDHPTESLALLVLRGKGDVFLADGVRERLKAALPVEIANSLPFPLVDEEIYEPPRETEDDDETLEEVTTRVVGALPRVQAIEAMMGYQNMKARLQEMLAGHAQAGRAVSKEDIEAVFERLRGGR